MIRGCLVPCTRCGARFLTAQSKVQISGFLPKQATPGPFYRNPMSLSPWPLSTCTPESSPRSSNSISHLVRPHLPSYSGPNFTFTIQFKELYFLIALILKSNSTSCASWFNIVKPLPPDRILTLSLVPSSVLTPVVKFRCNLCFPLCPWSASALTPAPSVTLASPDPAF